MKVKESSPGGQRTSSLGNVRVSTSKSSKIGAATSTPPATAKTSTKQAVVQRWMMAVKRLCFSEYYILNMLLVSTYILLRWRYSSSPLQGLQSLQLIPSEGWLSLLSGGGSSSSGTARISHTAADWQTWERQAGLACAVGSLWVMLRCRSIDAGAAATLRYAQLHVLIMALAASHVAFAYYAIGFALIFLIVAQLEYTCPSKVHTLTPKLLAEVLRLQGGSSLTTTITTTIEDDPFAVPVLTWVVAFSIPWHAGCRQMTAPLAELADTYTTDRLCFADIDIGEWPSLARHYGIDTSPASLQLPTLILFEKGQEVLRMPRVMVSSDGKGQLRGQNFRRRDIIRHFELDRRSGCYTSLEATAGALKAAGGRSGKVR